MRHLSGILMLASLATLASCEKKPEPAPKKAAEPAKPVTAEKVTDKQPPPPDAAPAEPAATTAEYDLSSQGAKWAGWTITAPAGATVETSEGSVAPGVGLRWGNGMGHVIVKQGKLDMRAVKKDILSDTEAKVTKDEPALVEATVVFANTPLKCFYMNYQVGKADVACWTGGCVQTDAELEDRKSVCRSLTKK